MDTKLMKRLAERGKFAVREGVEFIDGAWPHLRVRTWSGVARIVGEAKLEVHPDGRVFVRGQIKNHLAMAPRLFRNREDVKRVVSAEQEFAKKLGERLTEHRFRRENVGALLQHYGFKTGWLDVLDNLFVAYWFAAHKVSAGSDGCITVCESGSPEGWLFLIRPPASALVVDLRAEHHPLSARPHVQHGISLRSVEDGEDLRDWVVATIQTPAFGTTGGALFSGSALFPPQSSDHTLKLLLKPEISDLAADVESAHRLDRGTLGRTSWWPDADHD